MKTDTNLFMDYIDDATQHDVTTAALSIAGLVLEPRLFYPADLFLLPRASFTETFSCDEQWATQSQTWAGPRLLGVLNLAGLLPQAKYVRVGAGEYVVPVLLAEAGQALLADTLNGQPLTPEHGAPWRLAWPGAHCFTSVKWVDRLEVTAVRGTNAGARLTSARRRAERTAAAG
ncbi:MAG: molybdopterin-dependent oxidoreductase [Caldilineaceae bacterium]